MAKSKSTPDISVYDSGSIVTLSPRTRKAARWIDENIGPDNGFLPYYPTVVCEARYVEDIIDGMVADGLRVA